MLDKTWAKWDYLFVESYNRKVTSIEGMWLPEWTSDLGEHDGAFEVAAGLGAEGCELVSCTSPSDGWLVMAFKRLKV